MLHNQFDEAVTESYARLLRYAQFVMYPAHHDAADALNNVLLEFRQRYMSRFNFVSQAEFERYLKRMIMHRIFRLHKACRRSFGDHTFITDNPEAIQSPAPDPLVELIERRDREDYEQWVERMHALLPDAFNCLGKRELRVVCEVQSGTAKTALAQEYGVSSQRISQLYYRALGKMRRHLLAQNHDNTRRATCKK